MISFFLSLFFIYLFAGYVYCVFKTAEYLIDKRNINVFFGSVFGVIWSITWMLLTLQGIIELILGERDKPQ